MTRPVIGITCDTAAPNESDQRRRDFRYESPAEYASTVDRVGGTPLLLPYAIDRIADHLRVCDGILISGGNDPDTTAFGAPVHSEAKLVRPERQNYELALLAALESTDHPVLGVCLGMQWLALHAGGRLDQHLPVAESIGPDCAEHHCSGAHAIVRMVESHPVLSAGGVVHSRHHQAVADAGALRVIARSDPASGSVIEAVDRPGPRFWLGVQWHPEHTSDPNLGDGVVAALIEASRKP